MISEAPEFLLASLSDSTTQSQRNSVQKISTQQSKIQISTYVQFFDLVDSYNKRQLLCITRQEQVNENQLRE